MTVTTVRTVVFLLLVLGCLCERVVPKVEPTEETRVRSLTPETFKELTYTGNWLVSFCKESDPQCQESRKVFHSLEERPFVANFGEIDCDLYPELCEEHEVESIIYILFIEHEVPRGASRIPHFFEEETFDEDLWLWTLSVIRGCVLSLNNESFYSQTSTHEYLVIFMNNWEMDSRALFLEWRVVANMIALVEPPVRIARVECNNETAIICQNEGIEIVPSIKYYNGKYQRELIASREKDWNRDLIMKWFDATKSRILNNEPWEEFDLQKKLALEEATRNPEQAQLVSEEDNDVITSEQIVEQTAGVQPEPVADTIPHTEL